MVSGGSTAPVEVVSAWWQIRYDGVIVGVNCELDSQSQAHRPTTAVSSRKKLRFIKRFIKN